MINATFIFIHRVVYSIKIHTMELSRYRITSDDHCSLYCVELFDMYETWDTHHDLYIYRGLLEYQDLQLKQSNSMWNTILYFSLILKSIFLIEWRILSLRVYNLQLTIFLNECLFNTLSVFIQSEGDIANRRELTESSTITEF